MNARLTAPLFLVLCCLCLAGNAPHARADITWSGDLDPRDPTTWNSVTFGHVGKSAEGVLTVTDGDSLQSRNLYLGYEETGSGTATITGPGSQWISNNGYLRVGRDGSGLLTVADGGLVTNSRGYLGENGGSHGAATITGPASQWNSATLYVGFMGSASLTVENGGTVTSSWGHVGDFAGSTGMATITGPGSQWHNTRSLHVGRAGSGSLTVANGGLVTAPTIYASLADLHGDGAITATQGAVLDADLAFDAAHGAQFETTFGSGGTLSVTANGGRLGVGYNSIGTLSVAEGVVINSSNGYLGYHASSTGMATITGPGSEWSNTDEFFVGWVGSGSLTVEDGGVLASKHGAIGTNAGSTGAATITGPGSQWNSTHALYVGREGSGSLTVADGGVVTSSAGGIGSSDGSTGTATITGSGSRWDNYGSLHVGHNGSGSLTVADGGQVTTSTIYASLADLYGDGDITATRGAVLDADMTFDATYGTQFETTFGSGGTLSVATTRGVLGVGYKSMGNLSVTEGVVIDNSDGYLGYSAGSTGAATITGPGAEWNHTGTLYVGREGNGSLTIEAGGVVTSPVATLGNSAGSTGSATITGPGSQWDCSALLHVGREGNGSLTVTDGGAVTVGRLWASLEDLHGDGAITATQGAVLDADITFDAAHGTRFETTFGSGGTLSVATDGGDLGVGYKNAGTLSVAGGVAVSSSSSYLGFHPGATGSATITGPGSQWNIAVGLYVGSSGDGSITIEAGGKLSSQYAALGDAAGATGTATITGPGSQWDTTSSLLVGHRGTGLLTVEDGGRVTARNGEVGYGGPRNPQGATSAMGSATIAGVGSLWSVSESLRIGYIGSGELTITEGGLVSVGSTLTIDFFPDGDSFVNLATGGMLALHGDADDSLSQFFELVLGTDALRYWDAGLADWAPLTDATMGEDYTLEHLTTGELAGYTLLTVGTVSVPEPSAVLLAIAVAGCLLRRSPIASRLWPAAVR